MTNKQLPSWLVSTDQELNSEWSISGDMLVHSSVSLPSSHEFYEQVGGVEQHRWSSDNKRAAYYDHPRYKELVNRLIKTVDECSHAVDIGAGDGRITQMLLGASDAKIVSTDFHVPSLKRLLSNISEEHKPRHITAAGAVESTPVLSEFFDILTCIEVLCTVNDRRVGLDRIAKWLRPGGAALIIEPAIEGSLIYALLSGDDAAVKQIVDKHSRNDQIANNTLQVGLTTRSILHDEVTLAGLKIEHEESISAGAALMIHALGNQKTGFSPDDLSTVGSVDKLNLDLPRMHAVIAKKQ